MSEKDRKYQVRNLNPLSSQLENLTLEQGNTSQYLQYINPAEVFWTLDSLNSHKWTTCNNTGDIKVS